ncbi:MAG: TolC family protein [Pseudomonadota bacterium]
MSNSPARAGLFIVLLLVMWVFSARAENAADPLTLREAEQLALQNDPALPRFNALAQAQQERAVAEGQLPDPQLTVGVQDLPVDTFSRNQDDMTQVQVGVRQTFPAGDTLAQRGKQAAALADAESARALDAARKAVQAVRAAWLEAYYQAQAVQLVRQAQKLFAQVADVTQSQYSAGFVTQQDVIGAQLELNLLQDRETGIVAAREAAMAELGKWVGRHQLMRSLPEELPALTDPGARELIETALDAHPSMQVEDALVNAGQRGVDLARAQYKPSWEVDLSYGQRNGERADMASALVTIDLPIFTDKRQDRRLAASQQEVYAARYARDERRRELLHMLESEYAAWTRLGERVDYYEKTVLPQAAQNAASALRAYQANVTPFSDLIRARATELETRLQALRLRVDRAKAQANLLYLAGDTP